MLAVDSSNVLELRGLRNVVDDEYVNNAIVQATIVDANGDEITGETWPVSLSYVAASDGVYRYTLSYLIDLIVHMAVAEEYEIERHKLFSSIMGVDKASDE